MLLRAADRRGPRGGQRGHAAAWAARQPISPSVVESAADGQPTAPVGPRLPRPLSGVTLAGRLGRRGVTCYVQTDASRGLERENGGDLLRARARHVKTLVGTAEISIKTLMGTAEISIKTLMGTAEISIKT